MSRARLRGVSKVFVHTNVQTNVYVFVYTWGCCCLLWGVRGYTHIHISLDLGWVVCCSARGEARTHIYEERFVLVGNEHVRFVYRRIAGQFVLYTLDTEFIFRIDSVL